MLNNTTALNKLPWSVAVIELLSYIHVNIHNLSVACVVCIVMLIFHLSNVIECAKPAL